MLSDATRREQLSTQHPALSTTSKAGAAPLRVPLYSHVHYDVVGEEQIVEHADVVILEGLQSIRSGVDFSIYLDAPESELERWFLDRLLMLRRDPSSFLRAYEEDDLLAQAREVWRRINLTNLREHIAPTRELARVVVVKGADHAIREIRRR